MDRIEALETGKADKFGGATQEISIVGLVDGAPGEVSGLYDITSII